MSADWKQYQRKAADFYSRLGLAAIVEKKIDGARGVHTVDVYVEGNIHGIPFRWIVECKAWKTSVPKEKVLALAAIVQDVGADRGFLLSEKGFQSGAVRCAQRTNITLSSLEDLAAATKETYADAAMAAVNWRLSKARTRLRDIKKQKFDADHYPPMASELGALFVLEFALSDALRGNFPTAYVGEDGASHTANSLDELLEAASKIIAAAENWMPPDERKEDG